MTTVTKPNIVYTAEQQAAIDTLVRFVKGGKDTPQEIVFDAPGGCGKTTCLKEVINQVEGEYPITIITPTHRSKTICQQAINADVDKNDLFANYYVPKTLASALNKVPTVKVENGRKLFVQTGKKVETIKGVLLIDEASMIDSRDLERLRAIYDKSAKVIYTMDHKQLPPINNKGILPPVYEEGLQIVSLTTPMRFLLNSPIYAVTNQIRKKDAELSNFNYSGLATYCKDKPSINIYSDEDKFLEDALTVYEDKDWVNNPLACRILSYTNKNVDKYNKFIKQFYFDNETSNYVPTEILISRAPLVRSDPECLPSDIFNASSKNLVHLVSNGEEFKLLELESTNTFAHPKYSDKPIEYQIWSASREDEEDFKAILVSAKGKRNYKYVQSQLRKLAVETPDSKKKAKKKAWANLYKFTECFDNCRRASAITIHASQGSTFENVFVDLSLLDIDLSRRIRRALIYTAFTRPTTSLNIYIPSYHVAKSLKDTLR